MKTRVVVLGAGFGGLELATTLSEALGDDVEVTLIDKSDTFVFGFSKLDVMFGRTTLDAVQPALQRDRQARGALPAPDDHRDRSARPGRVSTDGGVHEADVLVVALGADYDLDATPGLAEGGNEFYSVAGAQRLGELLPTFSQGRAVIGVCGAPFKCPPAPSEAALLLHDYLSARGVREQCEISLVLPLPSPVPPSPETSRALEAAFAERDIEFVPGRRPSSLDPARRVVVLDDGSEMPYDLFLGVPKHRAPDVVIDSGMTEDGYVPVSPQTLQTRFPGVYAVGDVTTVGVPKAGVFAEGAARVVAASLIASIRGGEQPAPYDGIGTCYIEFGAGRVGRVTGGLPLRAEADRHLQRALRRPGRREAALRLQPPRPLVRPLTPPAHHTRLRAEGAALLTPDGVVNLDQLGLARLYADLCQHRHEALAERVELLPRVPDLADPQVGVRAEAHVIIEPVGRPVAGLFEPADGLVILLGGQRRWGEADQNAHGEDPPCSGEPDLSERERSGWVKGHSPAAVHAGSLGERHPGGVAERLNAAVLKTVGPGDRSPGFESRPLRCAEGVCGVSDNCPDHRNRSE